jgi:GntR family transcriptional regulator of vanillate catabolism
MCGLRDLLLNGSLEPGERLSELRLVDRLRVSRTPLRAALRSLAHEGLIDTLPGGGFVVRAFTPGDIVDTVVIRGVLEGTAARFAAERLESEDELEALRADARLMDEIVRTRNSEALGRYVGANDAFHSGLRTLAKSAELDRALDRALALPFAPPSALEMVNAASAEWWRAMRVAQQQHHALLEAIVDREGARADAIAREHARIALGRLDVAIGSSLLLREIPGSTLLRPSSCAT